MNKPALIHVHLHPSYLVASVLIATAACANAQVLRNQPTEPEFVTEGTSTTLAVRAGSDMQWQSEINSLSAVQSPTGSINHLGLLDNFGNNIVDSFTGINIYYHLAGVAATALIVPTGMDYDVWHYFNTHPEYGKWAHLVVFTGVFVPVITGGSLLAYGLLGNNKEVLGASFAVIQASTIELLYNTALKALTGRPHPDWRHVSNMDSLSRSFRFGFLRGGVFWGWPSGHTAATMAVVSALTSYYPHSTWLKIAGFSLVAYAIFGVSANNGGGMHWFSDAIAGALMSYAVGSAVGKYFRAAYAQDSQAPGKAATGTPEASFSPMRINISFQF